MSQHGLEGWHRSRRPILIEHRGAGIQEQHKRCCSWHSQALQRSNRFYSRGHQLVWGRQMIPGAPLQWLWEHPSDGFTEKPFGYPLQAFKDFQWDVVSLQPFDRGLTSQDGSDDVTKIRQYAELAAARNPNV